MALTNAIKEGVLLNQLLTELSRPPTKIIELIGLQKIGKPIHTNNLIVKSKSDLSIIHEFKKSYQFRFTN